MFSRLFYQPNVRIFRGSSRIAFTFCPGKENCFAGGPPEGCFSDGFVVVEVPVAEGRKICSLSWGGEPCQGAGKRSTGELRRSSPVDEFPRQNCPVEMPVYSSGAGGGVGKPASGACTAGSGSGGTGAIPSGPAWGRGAGAGAPGWCFGGRGGLPGLPGLGAFPGCGLCGPYAGGGGPGVGCGGRTAQESRDSTNTRASSPQRNRRVFMAAKGMILSKCRELSACLAKNGRGFYLPGKRIPPILASQRGEVSFILPGE